MQTNKQSEVAQPPTVQKVLVALCAAGTILLIGWLLKYSNYGIDFTDESFYLAWISNPFIYDASITQFGFLYHPLYKILNGNIATLRQANILITFTLAWGLAYSFIYSLAPRGNESRISQLTASAGLATSAFIIFGSWLPTPSYNSLNFQALLIAATGFILAEKKINRKSIAGWLLISVGGWLAFMAKPSTALGLCVGSLIYLQLSRKTSIRMLALATASALTLLLLSALLIDGSVPGFINRLQLGIEFARILGGGHTSGKIFRIDDLPLSSKFKIIIPIVGISLFLALWGMREKHKKFLKLEFTISIVLFTSTALLTLDQIHQATGLGNFQGLLLFLTLYVVVIASIMLDHLQMLKTISLQQWEIAAFFLAMPYIYALGTNGNYWQAGSSAAIFWLIASLTLLGPIMRKHTSWRLLLQFALASQAITAAFIQTGLERPYRQPQPLRLNASNLKVGAQGSALILSENYSTYISTASAAAKMAGFEPNTPLIDLSGQSPGILYAIGAEQIGQAWIIGGYPGSLNLAKAALTRTPCEKISAAWVLLEPEGARSIPTELMISLGTIFPNDYEQVESWKTATGAGDYPDRRTQELYRPLNQNKTLMNCRKLRKEIAQ
ncbi:MAG: hypothetical protein EKK45_10765 [Curvibacter sp.]|nr:MAG: hypothetical protein EKK45_10765 [Curvibacter sp.]